MATKKQKNIAIVSAAVAAAAVLIGTVLFLQNRAPEPEEIIVETLPPTEAMTEETEAPAETETEAPGLTARAIDLLAQNPDTVGWVKVENTNVDNPVVRGTDNEYYLDHGFDNQPFRAGTVFMDFRDIFGWPEEEQSENIILYGHNMANNTMFGSLRRYRQDYSYYKTAPFIELESNYMTYTYVIFATPITDGSAQATWRYWDMEDLSNKEEFDAYVETARKKSLSEIPIDVKYGDKLVTLSTCYSDADDSRFLIIGRRLRDGETKEELSKLLAE